MIKSSAISYRFVERSLMKRRLLHIILIHVIFAYTSAIVFAAEDFAPSFVTDRLNIENLCHTESFPRNDNIEKNVTFSFIYYYLKKITALSLSTNLGN